MLRRRLAAVASAIVLALGATALAAGPAHATDPTCSTGVGHYQQAGGFITGFKFRYCDNQPDVPLWVTVQRYMSPGVYEVIAAGFGEATYYCGGFNFGRFRAGTNTDFDILCT